jgi:hypothetical protein
MSPAEAQAMKTRDPGLGRLQKVELREVWATEAGDFTPWLARAENIRLLGDTIGLDLEVEAQEKGVGPFRADILCRNTAAADHWVLVENQLDRTDHVHLGQLLTYAAGLHAVTIVWVAQRFTEEHRAALDWLNEITGEEFLFFGLEVELWRIGDSPIAPKFNVVCQPNDWSRTVTSVARAGANGEISETRQLQLEYWTAFRQLMDERGGLVRGTKPQPQHWLYFSIGRGGFILGTFASMRDEWIGVQLILTGKLAKAHFHLLEKSRQEIDAELGVALDWRELPDRKESRVGRFLDCDPADRTKWAEQHQWLYDNLQRFHQIFSSRIKDLDVDDWDSEEVGE